jgi:hypothetical protein
MAYTKHKVEEQDITILDMYLAGRSERDIAITLGMANVTVHRRITKILAAIPPMDVDTHRKIIAKQLKRIIAKLDPGMDGDAATRALTAGKLLAALDSLKRLHGLDSPTKTEVEVINLTPEDIELRAMVQAINSRAERTTDA